MMRVADSARPGGFAPLSRSEFLIDKQRVLGARNLRVGVPVSRQRNQPRTSQARASPPFGADIALMPAGIWLAHIGIFGAE
jgi:hypothetical protein